MDPSSPRPLAIVTGASSGIGAALAPLLAAEGYDLLLVARRELLLLDLARTIAAALPGAHAEAFTLDLATPEAGRRLFERAPDARLVVNSAGFGVIGPALEADLDTYRRMIALNVSALTEVTYLFARRMAERGGGTILNIASTAAFGPLPYASVYAATKSYVVALSEGLHFELRGRGVRVLAFCPGPTDTAFGEAAGASAADLARGKPFFLGPDVVARKALRAIRRGAETKVPGALNNVLAFLQRHGPRRAVRWFGAYAFRPRAPGPRGEAVERPLD